MAAFLRAINALENIRQSIELLEAKADNRILPHENFDELIDRALNEIDDASMVLAGAGLHPGAVARLREARRLSVEASRRRRPAIVARDAIDIRNRENRVLRRGHSYADRS